MNRINEDRVGRDVHLCAFGARSFRVVIFVGVVFGLVVAQVRGDEKFDVAVVMNLMTK